MNLLGVEHVWKNSIEETIADYLASIGTELVLIARSPVERTNYYAILKKNEEYVLTVIPTSRKGGNLHFDLHHELNEPHLRFPPRHVLKMMRSLRESTTAFQREAETYLSLHPDPIPGRRVVFSPPLQVNGGIVEGVECAKYHRGHMILIGIEGGNTYKINLRNQVEHRNWRIV